LEAIPFEIYLAYLLELHLVRENLYTNRYKNKENRNNSHLFLQLHRKLTQKTSHLASLEKALTKDGLKAARENSSADDDDSCRGELIAMESS
jgi:hypothetical protein